MSKNKKIILYSSLLILGLAVFSLEVFVFQFFDGNVGFIICLMSFYLVLGSVIKLCRLSEKFKNSIVGIIDLLFWLP